MASLPQPREPNPARTEPDRPVLKLYGATPVPFHTEYRYHDRASKARYVWEKYQSILRGARILDVGADECHLKRHLDCNASYWGIGLGGSPDQEVDLERGPLPFPDNAFDCVLCLDVLEHLEAIHFVFDELCRVAKRHVIISLPNPWKELWSAMRCKVRPADCPTKFYGLPLERPGDRHRWFFNCEEARRFIEYRAAKCGMHVLQVDVEGESGNRWWKRWRRRWAVRWLRSDLSADVLYAGTLWAVLEKSDG